MKIHSREKKFTKMKILLNKHPPFNTELSQPALKQQQQQQNLFALL